MPNFNPIGRFAIILLLFLSVPSLQATHIVGGEMNYSCLGNNDYEITLTIFRDCFNGNPNAWFDNPASIGIFHGATNQLLEEVLIPWDPILNDTLDPVLSSECLVVPPDVCVHTTTYTAIVNLPPQIGGYTLAYQRCCRNQTITNITAPLETGATYSVFISEKALLECNSNPKFNTWPPLYICVDEPISFDQSAIDIDGDSIVYKLCTPLEGADPSDPMPQPPNPPPYQPIQWIDPPYNVANMLNGNTGGVPLTIDPETGLLEGVPNTIGQFVVGICVEEYRDGELISTTRRDFQYNVGVCGETTAGFTAPEVQCDDLMVFFDNQSSNADDFLWFFGDPDNPGPNSTASNPFYTYPDTGLYEVSLIVEPGSICADTFITEVYLAANSLQPDYSYEVAECSDSLVLDLQDLTTDPVSEPVAWQWSLNNGQSGTGSDTTLVVYASGDVILTLTVQAENGCESTLTDTIPVNLVEEELPADTLVICPGDTTSLNSMFNPAYDYLWSPVSSLSDPTVPNPLAYPPATTEYTVVISDGADCAIERTITAFVPPEIEVEVTPDTTTCEAEVELYAFSDQATEYYWATDADLDELISLNPMVAVTPYGDTTFYLLLRDTFGCALFDSVQLNGIGINTELDSFAYICLGDSLSFSLQNLDPADQLTYNWGPDSIILNGDGTSQVWVQPTSSGLQPLWVETNNQLGCSRIDTVLLAVIDTLEDSEVLAYTQCSGYSVQFVNESPIADLYEWYFGDPTNPGASSNDTEPYYTYDAPGTYEVMLSLPANAPCPDTILLEVEVGEPEIEVAFDFSYLNCADTVVIQFEDASVNTQSTITGIQWFFSNGETSDLPDPQITLYENQQLQASLVLTSDDGCVDTLTQELAVELLSVNLPDTVIICNQQALPLNPDFNPNYQYFWSPASGLSDAQSPNPLANPDQTTVYTALVLTTSPDTCSITASVTALVPPPLNFSASSDTTVCDESFLLTVDTDPALQLSWSDDPSFGSILGTDPELLVDLPPGISTYYLEVADTFGCRKVDTIELYQAAPTVSYLPERFICLLDTLALSVMNQNPDQVLTFSWMPDNQIIEGQSTAEITVSPPQTTTYDFTATNQYGCTVAGSILVDIFDFVPPLAASANPDTIVAGQSSQLLATIDPGYTYTWSPAGSLSDPSLPDPLAMPGETTTYTVEIINADGCRNFAEVRVVVIEPICGHPYIFVPTAFSPNNDGHNDTYRIRGDYIEVFRLMIYTRWGELVFESTDPNEGWDGTFRGEPLPPDVFAYYLELQCVGGSLFTDKGNITLMR